MLQPAANPAIVFQGLEEYGVRVLPSGNPGFDRALEGFPGRIPAAFKDVLPYCLIVQNRTSRPIMSFTVRIEFLNPEGKPIYHEFTTGNAPADDPRSSLQPGRSRFVCPEPRINSVVNMGVALPAAIEGDLAARVKERLAMYAHQKQPIRIVLDSAVFTDGELVGPDASRMENRLNSMRQAEDDVVREISAARFDPGAIRAYLKAASEVEERPAYTAADVDYYGRRKQSIARYLLERFDGTSAVEAFMSEIEKLMAKQGPPWPACGRRGGFDAGGNKLR